MEEWTGGLSSAWARDGSDPSSEKAPRRVLQMNGRSTYEQTVALFVNRIPLVRFLDVACGTVLTGTTVTRVTDTGIVVSDAAGAHEVPCDTVAAIGVRPAAEFMSDLAGRDYSVHAIGDCVQPRKVGDAINVGCVLAASLERDGGGRGEQDSSTPAASGTVCPVSQSTL